MAHLRPKPFERDHPCVWPKCKRNVRPTHFMCEHHWQMVPLKVRSQLWTGFANNDNELFQAAAARIMKIYQQQEAHRAQQAALRRRTA